MSRYRQRPNPEQIAAHCEFVSQAFGQRHAAERDGNGSELEREQLTERPGDLSMPLIIGIDPGISGAMAVLSPAGVPEFVSDLPVIRDRSLAWVDGGELQRLLLDAIRGRQARAVVERVSAMPRQGVASSFQFGVGLGSILGVLQALQIRTEFVTPAVWKRALGLGADKRASLHKARLLFPSVDLRLAKHEGRAEALLIAYHVLRRSGASSEQTGVTAGNALPCLS